MDIKSLLQNKKFEKIEKNNLQQFQDKAIRICNDFNITGIYRQIIFRQAKRNVSYLEGKVALCIEKFGEKGINNKGNYLISLFRKRKPWEK